MRETLITSRDAYKLVAKDNPFRAASLICARAHDGILVAYAQILFWADERQENCSIPTEFWWARGGQALKQSWDAGDFETTIDGKLHCRAYGVTFRLNEIEAMIPGIKKDEFHSGEHGQSEPDTYLSSAEAIREVKNGINVDQKRAADLIIRYCGAQLVQSKCKSMSIETTTRYGTSVESFDDCDIPNDLWRGISFHFGGVTDWSKGRFHGQIIDDGDRLKITIIGACFRKDDISDLVASEKFTMPANLLGNARGPSGEPAARGRKPVYDWDGAVATIWGQIYRGDLQPENQAQIERAFQAHLADGDKEPLESTVRPYASRIWQELQKA